MPYIELKNDKNVSLPEKGRKQNFCSNSMDMQAFSITDQ